MTKWKKVTALATGALMLGATLAGAFAVEDLATYPAPFVESGALNDAVIVVGKAAETADVLGAIDIAAALQAAAVSQIEIEGTAAAPTVSDGVKIEKSGDKFNYGEDFYDVQPTSLDDSDLPIVLKKETLDENQGATTNKEEYEQTLAFTDGTGTFMLTQPEDKEGGKYLLFDDGETFYTYTVSFDSAVTFSTSASAADWEGANLILQGNVYTITDIGTTSNLLDDITLVAGDSTVWLVQDQPYTVGGHTVTTVDVDNSETKCGVNVDGVTKWVDEGSTEEFGDLTVSVLDVVAVYTKDYDADTCELSLGSSEIRLQDGDAVQVNGVDLDGSVVTFTGTSTAGQWTGFTIAYDIGDEDTGINSDEVALTPGEAWSDPVFGNWKILFEGMTATTEDFTLKRTSSEKVNFKFLNTDGVEVTVPWRRTTGTTTYLGVDSDETLLLVGEKVTSTNPEKEMLMYTTSGGETHILQIDRVYDTTGSNANKTTIKDLTYDKTVADKQAFTPGAVSTVSLGSLGSIKLNLTTGSSGTVDFINGPGNGTPETKYGATLTFNDTTVVISEEDVKETSEITGRDIRLDMAYDSTNDNRMELQTPSGTFLYSGIDFTEDNSDDKYYVTAKGSWFEYDTENQDEVVMIYPEEDVYANVFVTPLTASVVSGGSSGTTADQVNPFSVGLAVLDTDAESMTKNMIVVGGPCINTVAAELLENPEACTEGFEAGKAKLKYFDRNEKAALLVAGYGADDTMGASRVLADYEDYDLSGDEVEVVVTSLDQISVSTV